MRVKHLRNVIATTLDNPGSNPEIYIPSGSGYSQQVPRDVKPTALALAIVWASSSRRCQRHEGPAAKTRDSPAEVLQFVTGTVPQTYSSKKALLYMCRSRPDIKYTTLREPPCLLATARGTVQDIPTVPPFD
jgi:hypothetical protein